MLFKQEKSSQLSTLNKIQVFEPTYRNVLYIISQDKEAFAGKGMIELLKSVQSNTTNPKMAAMLGIYMEVLQKGLVSQDGLKNRITLKGRWYLISTHYSIGLWGIVLAFFVGVAAISIPQYILHLSKSAFQPIKPKESSSLSVPAHPSIDQKNSSKKK